jgi:hypothetical protein
MSLWKPLSMMTWERKWCVLSDETLDEMQCDQTTFNTPVRWISQETGVKSSAHAATNRLVRIQTNLQSCVKTFVCETCMVVKDWAHNISGVRIISSPWWPASSHYFTPRIDYLGEGGSSFNDNTFKSNPYDKEIIRRAVSVIFWQERQTGFLITCWRRFLPSPAATCGLTQAVSVDTMSGFRWSSTM